MTRARIRVGCRTDAQQTLLVPARLEVEDQRVGGNSVIEESRSDKTSRGLDGLNRDREVRMQVHVLGPEARCTPPRAIGAQEGAQQNRSDLWRGLLNERCRPAEFN